jgi:hypothetical protein
MQYRRGFHRNVKSSFSFGTLQEVLLEVLQGNCRVLLQSLFSPVVAFTQVSKPSPHRVTLYVLPAQRKRGDAVFDIYVAFSNRVAYKPVAYSGFG